MSNSLFEKFVNVFSWLAYGLTAFLSIYAVSKIMSMPGWYWLIIAFVAGAVVNTGEMLSWHRFNRNNSEKLRLDILIKKAYTDSDRNEMEILLKKRMKWHPLVVCLIAASLSIAGTFFALQSGYDRGKEIDKIQETLMKQLGLREGIINQYQLNSQEARSQAQMKRMLSNMYLNKSDEFLQKAANMLGSNAKELEFLKDNIENKVALGVYNTYASLFGGDPQYWALIFNTILALIIETIFLYLAYEAYQTNNPLPYIKELGEKEVQIKIEKPRKEPDPIPALVSANEVQTNNEKEAQIAVQKLISEIDQKKDGNGANANNGSKKKTISSSLHLPQKSKVNKRGKKKKNLHSKICFEYMQQEAQIKEGFRFEINESEIAKKCGCTRPNVDYHLRKENLKN